MRQLDSDGWSAGTAAIAGFAVALAVAFAVNLAWELRTLSTLVPPVLVFLLGLTLSGLLGYAAVWLKREPYPPEETRRIAAWVGSGAVLLVLVSGVGLAIRSLEGRAIGEPQLDLLLSAGAGGLAGVVAGHREVVARRRTGEVERTRDTLSFLNRTLRHEMLNGIQLVSGHARNLRGHVDEEASHSLETIEETSEELVALVKDVRQVADIHAGRADLRPLDVTELLAEDADWLDDAYPEATVETDLPDGAVVDATDALDRAFRNLLSNAVEHGGDAPTVEVTAETSAGTVEVRVADDGPGIPDDQKDAVLEADDGRTHGFGLHLTRTLVEGYGGAIAVTDSEPSGAEFVVRLPRTGRPRADGAPDAGGPDMFEEGAADSTEQVDARTNP